MMNKCLPRNKTAMGQDCFWTIKSVVVTKQQIRAEKWNEKQSKLDERILYAICTVILINVNVK